jgi:hypothetical protein
MFNVRKMAKLAHKALWAKNSQPLIVGHLRSWYPALPQKTEQKKQLRPFHPAP